MLVLRERAASVYWAPTSLPREQTCPVTEADQLTFANWSELEIKEHRNSKSVSAAVENEASAKVQTGEAMNNLMNEVPKFVTQARASFLLGIAPQDLRRISDESGLGHVERVGNEEELYFTYEIGRASCRERG